MTELEFELAIQRCLHGELTTERRETLFIELERVPGGWRQLALAFVEEQTWGTACRDLVVEPSAPPEVNQTVRTVGEAKNKSFGKSFRWTAVAGLLVALGVGYGAGHLSGRRPSEGPVLVSTDEPSQIPMQPNGAPEREATLVNSLPPSPSRQTASAMRATPVMRVSTGSPAPYTLDLPLTGSGDEMQSVQIPVYRPSSLPRQSRPQIKNVLTDSQRSELERLGYRVDRERQVIAVPLKNGERVLVPVDSYGVRYGMQ